MSQWNREIAPVLYQHTTRQMGRRPTGMPHKADKLDSAVNVLCYCPGIMEALSRVPAIRGYARTCRWDSLTGELNTTGKKRNPYLQHTEQRKRDAPHESKEPKVKKQVRYALAAAVHPSEPTPSGGKSLLERATATI